MSEKTMAAVLLSTLCGVLGTGVGGLTGALLGMRGKRLIPLLFHLSSGMMIAVVCFELLPEAYAMSLGAAVMGMMLGVLCVMALSVALDRHKTQQTDAAAMRRTGLLVLLSLALHNFPEGLAVGAGFAAEPKLGIMLGAMIMLHDVPEGPAAARKRPAHCPCVWDDGAQRPAHGFGRPDWLCGQRAVGGSGGL